MNFLNNKVHLILYIQNQNISKDFYEKLFNISPHLDVPGMTEFILRDNLILGLMPCEGIAKIITPVLPDPAMARGIPRCELYFYVDSAVTFYNHALSIGAKDISRPKMRSWNHIVGYVADPDGHVLAFAEGE